MIHLDRRQLIVSAAFGLGGLILPGGRAFGQAMAAARGFTHNVASGEPSDDSVLLWTRFVGDADSAHVRAQISVTPDFARVISGAQVITGAWRDWTVKATVDGLSPGRTYYYRFIGPDGGLSPVGRTRTLPDTGAKAARMAVFSCANIGFGYFNAYAHAAARDDLDFWFHVGDYLYEAELGTYPTLNAAIRTAEIVPSTELIHLADYRMRYAAYRTDPDLQALHAQHPMISLPDDHDSANDTWEGGAGGHQPNEGSWDIRRAAALQARDEWLPIDEQPWKSYRIGSLATLHRTETRTIARSRQASLAKIMAGDDKAAGLRAFASDQWRDPAMTILGTTQEHWLADEVRQSVRAGFRWQVVGVGTVMGFSLLPPTADKWLAADARPVWHQRFALSAFAANEGLPSNFDNWGGYPAARARFLSSMQRAGANAIVVSGDSHNAWAFEMAHDNGAAAVEFSGQSVTPPGIDEATGNTDPRRVAADLVGANPELKWADTSRRGYMALTLTPTVAINEWVFMQTVTARSVATLASHRMKVRQGRHKLEDA